MKVDCIILGGQKCGTTALHNYLSKHKKVIASRPKEIDFFNYNFNYNKGFTYYHSFFKKQPFLAKQRGFKFIEASPSYINGEQFINHNTTSKRIFEYNPDIKLICLVRNPIARSFSAWNMFKARYQSNHKNWWFDWYHQRLGEKPKAVKRTETSFNNYNLFIEEELAALKKGNTIECPVIEGGYYVQNLENYISLFKENLKIIKNEELNTNTIKVLESISSFINLEPIDWSLVNTKKIFEGNYNEKIDLATKKLLKQHYLQANQELFNLTKIDYR